jgi:hypothetical protein
MLLNLLIIVSLYFINPLNDKPKDRSIFISPLKQSVSLTSNFGDLRLDHFHSGLDLKTEGVTGKEVFAASDGYVYRISVSPGGFGKALYLRHPSGYSTVYAHLERFSPVIEEYVVAQQYAKKSYLVALIPQKEKFTVKKGELIAFSGNSGSSTGPHLHFEVRKSESEIPINPLLFEFGAADNIKPIIENLVIYPITQSTLINDNNSVKKISVSGGKSNYYIPSENEIRINGLAGFGIKAYDLLNDSNYKCAVYSIRLSVDSVSIFNYIMDGFSFSESRFINSHIDYETFMRDNIYIERMYTLPNDKLSVYKDILNRGIFNFCDNRTHNIEVVVTDIQNNKSVLTFRVKADSVKGPKVKGLTNSNLTIMPFNKSNMFVSDGISVNIPNGALYDTLYFDYKKIPGNEEMLSDIHYVHNKFSPLHKSYILSIKPSKIFPGKESKMLIAEINGDEGKKISFISKWEEGFMTAEVSSFGKFYIGIDTIGPQISANGLLPGADLTERKEIRIRITDDFSGIKSYYPVIDSKWALFEYDQKNDVLIYRFDPGRIIKGTHHSLSLTVTDNKDNQSFYNCDFRW